MLYVILSVAFAFLIYAPSLWVRIVMHKHSRTLKHMPGTGGELAEHLIQRYELEPVRVEKTTEHNDHYDPVAQVVRLSPSNYDGKSLTAVAVAAHEMGHAIQFQRKEKISRLRMRYIPPATMLKKTGILLMALVPVAGFVIKAPVAVITIIIISIVLQLLGALAYLIVLPEELDASFNKAMPILVQGDYVRQRDIPAVRVVLKAAALTYFAGALVDVINIGRWLSVLRR